MVRFKDYPGGIAPRFKFTKSDQRALNNEILAPVENIGDYECAEAFMAFRYNRVDASGVPHK